MEILLILVLAVIVVPFCYYKGIKKGIDSVVWDLYVSNKISKEDKKNIQKTVLLLQLSLNN